MKYPSQERPKPVSSFELPKRSFTERFKLAVVCADDVSDVGVWGSIAHVLADKDPDPIILATRPQCAAARWGYWYWCPVRLFGSEEDDDMLKEADRLLVVGPKSDEMMAYYANLAKYHKTPVTWAVPKGSQ